MVSRELNIISIYCFWPCKFWEKMVYVWYGLLLIIRVGIQLGGRVSI